MLKTDANNMATHHDNKFVWQAMRDYKTYMQIGIYMGSVLEILVACLTANIILMIYVVL
jgi:hypothetical protein